MGDPPVFGHVTPDPRRKPLSLPQDDPTPVDGVRLDEALRDSIVVDLAMPPDKGLMLGAQGSAVGIDFAYGPDHTAQVVVVGRHTFTVGQEVTWRGARWVVEGHDERTSRSGRPCVKLRGYRYAVDAKEIT